LTCLVPQEETAHDAEAGERSQVWSQLLNVIVEENKWCHMVEVGQVSDEKYISLRKVCGKIWNGNNCYNIFKAGLLSSNYLQCVENVTRS